METDRIRMESDPDIIFYHILVRIQIHIWIFSNTNTKWMSWIRISIQIFTQSDMFVPGRPIRGTSIGWCPRSERASALVASNLWVSAYRQLARTARPRVGTAQAPSHFPRSSMWNTPIYFWNIQIQHFQHTKEDRWSTWNMLLEHLKKHLKTLENHWKHTQSR